MIDVMVDLETFGTAPGSVIVSIGAVVFDIEAGAQADFYATIDPRSAQDAGLTLDADTVSWWLRQSDAARRDLQDGVQIHRVLRVFADWLPPSPLIWGNGATFDCGLLRAAYEACGIDVPWGYRDDRDMRTVLDLVDRIVHGLPPEMEGKDTEHNALQDAHWQVRRMQDVYCYLLRCID